jgi:Mg2+ and Co2+ transporter CorA
MSSSSIRSPSKIRHFGQRAKLDDYDDFVFLVVYGAVPDQDRLVEVHCIYSERFLITVHRDEAPAFTEVRNRHQKRMTPIDDPALLLYRIIDALVDSFFLSSLTSTTESKNSRTRPSCTRATSSCRRSSR